MPDQHPIASPHVGFDPRLRAATNLQTNPAKYFAVYTPSGVYAYDAENADDALRILGECVPGVDLLACWAQSLQDMDAALERYQALPEDQRIPTMLRDAVVRAQRVKAESEQLKQQKPF